MKISAKTIVRSIFATVIALSMLLSVCVPAIAATVIELQLDKNNDNKINYVAFGASNTNGYGHLGYLPPEVSEDPLAASKAELNDYGYNRAPENSCPALIEKALEKAGYDVELAQLAISSMRVEEIRVLLDNEYYGDAYTEWRFTGGQGWFEIAEPGGISALRDSYQNAVKNADLITLDAGWNNFGVYAFNNIKTILSDGKYWKAPDFEQLDGVDEQIKYEKIKAIAFNYLKSNVGMDDPALLEKLDMIADVLAYTAIGACYHHDIIVEKIRELNPEATIVVLNIQNLADDLVVDLDGTVIELGDLYDKLISVVDEYRRTVSSYNDEYMFANVGDVTTFLDEIVAWNGDPATITRDMRDCFDMYDDSLYVRSIVEYMLVGQALSGVFKGFREMAASYGLSAFNDDAKYTYDFALTRTPEQLLSLNLAKLDLNNPSGADADVEAYGQALSKHLYNLRHYNEGGKNAYNYVFEDLLAALKTQKTDVTGLLETLKAQKNTVVAEMTAGEEALATARTEKAALEAQLADATDPTVIATLQAYIDTYTTEIAKGEADLEAAKNNYLIPLNNGIAEAEAGIAQLTQAIDVIVPSAKAEFATMLEAVYKTYINTLYYAYDVVATFVQAAAKINTIEITADSLAGFNSAADTMMGLVVNDFIGGAISKFNYELYTNGLSATPADPVPEYVMDESVFDNAAVRAIAVLAVRYELGNSFFAHPNVEGNKQTRDAVLLALARNKTAKEDSETDMLAAWNWFMDYVEENYPDTYEVYLNVADYVGSEEFSELCELLEDLYLRADAATTPEQKAALLNETYELVKRLQSVAAKATANKVENIYHYLSIGDSTLSGYGLDKYEHGQQNGEGQILGNEVPVLLAKKLFGESYVEVETGHSSIVRLDFGEGTLTKLDKGGLRTNEILVYLGLEEYADGFYDVYTVDNSKYHTEFYQELYQSEIKKADLITLTIGGVDISSYVEKQIKSMLEGNEPYELDWSIYFPDADMTEVYAYIESVQVMMEGVLPEILGLPAEEIAPVAAECFVYGLVGYFNNYTKIVDRIHELNPDAHVVLVGYFNTVDNMMMPITLEGQTIELPIGDMLGMLVETSNATALAYALAHNDYVTYVSTCDATTILDEQGRFDYESRIEGIWGKPWLSHAGAEGHKYITEQIYTAITNEYTNEEIAADAIAALKDYYKFLEDEFGDEIVNALTTLLKDSYKNAYAEALAAGKIDELNAYLDAAEDAIDAAEAWALENKDYFRSEAFATEILNAAADAKATIAALRALVNNADELDGETYDYALKLCAALGANVEDLAALITVAANDAGNYLYEQALELNAKAEAQIAILKATLEKKIAKLEAEAAAKIAELEAELDAAVGEAREAILAQIAAVNAELDAAIARLEAKVAAEIARIDSELLEANAAIEAKIAEMNAEVAAILADIENKADTVKASIILAINEMIVDAHDYFKSNLPVAYTYLVNLILDYLPAADRYLYDWFYNNPEVVIGFFAEYGDEMGDFIVENANVIVPVFAYIIITLGDDALEYVINNADALLPAFTDWYNTYGDRALAMIKVYLNALGVNTDVDFDLLEKIEGVFAIVDKLASFELELDEKELIATLEGFLASVKTELWNKLNELENVKKAELEAALDALTAKLEALKAQCDALAAKLETLKAELDAAIIAGNQAIADKINAEIAKTQAAIAEINAKIAELNAKIDAVKAEIESVVAEIMALRAAIKTAVAEIAEKLEAVKAAVKKIAETVDYLAGIIDVEDIAAAIKTVREIVNALENADPAEYEAKLEALVAELSAEIENAKAYLSYVKLVVATAIEGAMNGYYFVDEDSLLVSIGDLAAEGFSELLADNLGIDFEALLYEDSIDDIITMIEDNADVLGDADLVTVSLSNTAITEYMFNRMDSVLSGKKLEALDWESVLGDKAYIAPLAVEAARAKLVENGYDFELLGVSLADLLTVGVESYLYATAKRATVLPEIFAALSEAAPNALIVNVGVYNDLEGVVIELDGTVIDLGKYLDFAADLANINTLAQTVLSGENMVFVSAPDVETILESDLENGEYDNVTLLTFFNAIINGDLNPSEAGAAYIVEQILNAVEVEFEDVEDEECEHVWGEWVTVKPATETEEGLRERTCVKCGEKETEILEKLPAVTTPEQPETSDTPVDTTVPSDTPIETTPDETTPDDTPVDTPVETTPVETTPVDTPEVTEPATDVPAGLPTGAIVGISIAAVAVVAAGAFCLYWFVFKKKIA